MSAPQDDLIRSTAIELIADQLGCPVEEIEDSSSFKDDLGADSLDELELLMAAEERFGIAVPEDAAEQWQTVGQAIAWLHANGARIVPAPAKGW